MLTIGLTGGIGSGKSAVAGMLAGLGAAVVDADVLAREVVAVGTPGLAAVATAFGPDLLRPDGSLDRPALGRLVFADPAVRRRLDAIVHPLVGERTRTLVEQAEQAGTQVLVHDVPLLVELGFGAAYHVVVVVDAPVALRLARLTHRGLPRDQAQARIAAQADEAARRAAADVWLDNSGTREQLAAQVRALHAGRLTPYARHLADRTPAPQASLEPVAPRPSWPVEGARLVSRLRYLCGAGARVEHVGPAAAPGPAAPDLIHLRVEVPGWEDVEALAEPLAAGGFPRADEPADSREAAGAGTTQRHGSADPGRPAEVLLGHRGRTG